MAERMDWAATEARAAKMDAAKLAYAIVDCTAAAKTLGTTEMIGKDASYYMDEASVYYRALRKFTVDQLRVAGREAMTTARAFNCDASYRMAGLLFGTADKVKNEEETG